MTDPPRGLVPLLFYVRISSFSAAAFDHVAVVEVDVGGEEIVGDWEVSSL